MRVQLLPCGPFANESERVATNVVKSSLLRFEAPGTAYILTNLTHPNAHGQADEIDLIVVGPGGAALVEVKHWEAGRLRRPDEADSAADLILTKTRRVAGRLRTVEPSISFVPAAFLLTLEHGSLKRNGKQVEHPKGVRAYGLKDVDALCADLVRGRLNSERLANALAPRQLAEAGPGAKRLGRFDDLKLLSHPDDLFARVHLARDPATGERVILHSYDFTSALSSDAMALTERRAKREFEVVRRYQKSPYLPSLVDSWQALPNYGGELFFFTLADSGARSVAEAMSDATWTGSERRAFTLSALKALAELGSPSDADDEPLVHRALDPDTVRVRANGKPLFSGWSWARIPLAQTISVAGSVQTEWTYAAPEVQAGGLATATPASDVFSICKVLFEVFALDTADDQRVKDVLLLGLDANPSRRPKAQELVELLADQTPTPQKITLQSFEIEAVSAARWDEDYEFSWQGNRYRVSAVLGQGAIGRTFRLEQLDAQPVRVERGKGGQRMNNRRLSELIGSIRLP